MTRDTFINNSKKYFEIDLKKSAFLVNLDMKLAFFERICNVFCALYKTVNLKVSVIQTLLCDIKKDEDNKPVFFLVEILQVWFSKKIFV